MGDGEKTNKDFDAPHDFEREDLRGAAVGDEDEVVAMREVGPSHDSTAGFAGVRVLFEGPGGGVRVWGFGELESHCCGGVRMMGNGGGGG